MGFENWTDSHIKEYDNRKQALLIIGVNSQLNHVIKTTGKMSLKKLSHCVDN